MHRHTWVLLVLMTGCQEYDLQADTPGVSGPRPEIQVEPMTISFGQQLRDCPTDPRTVTVRNIGGTQLRISDLGLTGDVAAYTLLGEAIDLDPGEDFELDLVFEAGANTTYDAELRIRSNDPVDGLVAVDLTGAGGDQAYNEDLFEQATPSAVDVLWVLDHSCSMSSLMADLDTAFSTFIESFVTMGLDYNIGITTADMEDGGEKGTLIGDTPVMKSSTMTDQEIITAFEEALAPILNRDIVGSATEKALGGAYAALEDPGHAVADGLIREDANLAVIIIGDEDDQTEPIQPSFYTDWINDYKVGDPNRSTVSGLITYDMFDFDGGSCGVPMPRVQEVIENTGGHHTNLCDVDFEDVMTWLSFTAAGLKTWFPLNGTPANGAVGMQVEVDGVSVTMDPFRIDGWDYNHSQNRVSFYGPAIPQAASDIAITYPIAGDCQN